ncbi:MAG TPA: SDR family NAD(P)-dependent oxidoreductase, partial [Thermoanaerobaculia bacterium]|nr:SDR family NAD(P)-dependent oxidoreductase [Thermoanaerobaculia bacterium]
MSEDLSNVAMTSGVQRVFAQVTRYPLEILDPQAPLEEELGIDSVKLGEVFAVLRETYGLPPQIGIPPEQLRTIGGIAGALAEYLAERRAHEAGTNGAAINGSGVNGAAAASGNGHVGAAVNGHVEPPAQVIESAPNPAAAPSPQPAPPVSFAAPAAPSKRSSKHSNGSLEPATFLESIRAIFAEVTRYPVDILEPDAALEEDLGIDSVKLGEVFAVLRDRYELPPQIGIPPEELRTIGSIATALRRYLAAEAAAAAAAAIQVEHVEPVAEPTIEAVISSNGNHGTIAIEPLPAVVAESFAALTPALRPFAGKIALVTGSGRGIGKEIATYLGELGATVVVNSFHSRERGIETAEEIRGKGGEAIHVWASVA